jgi:hypothetical protein
MRKKGRNELGAIQQTQEKAERAVKIQPERESTSVFGAKETRETE